MDAVSAVLQVCRDRRIRSLRTRKGGADSADVLVDHVPAKPTATDHFISDCPQVLVGKSIRRLIAVDFDGKGQCRPVVSIFRFPKPAVGIFKICRYHFVKGDVPFILWD